jgi:hypothetical protein
LALTTFSKAAMGDGHRQLGKDLLVRRVLYCPPCWIVNKYVEVNPNK